MIRHRFFSAGSWTLVMLWLLLAGVIFASSPVMAADAAGGEVVGGDVAPAIAERYEPKFFLGWGIALVAALAALAQAVFFFKAMIRSDDGDARMVEIAGHVREGANAYLSQQFKVVAAFFAVVVLLLAGAAFGLEVQSRFVPFAFLTSGFLSGLAGWFGMKTATWASSRTCAGARESLNSGLQVAFRSGAVMGLTVVGLALLDVTFWFGFLFWVLPMFAEDAVLGPRLLSVTMLSFGMGASAQALFARVGGGIFTKAADVGADLVGKVEQGIPEDDPRNPATIADNVGDNVGDVAGMGADLFESYYGSILATAALGAAAFSNPTLLAATKMTALQAQVQAILLPMVIAGAGIVLSIAGIYLVQTSENASQKNLLKALGRGIGISTGLVIVAAIILCWWMMPPLDGITAMFGVPGVAWSVVVGVLAGWGIGKWTEYVTSDEFTPTKKLAEQSVTGPATLIIGGIADGMMSVWVPVVIICMAMLAAFGFACGWQFSEVSFFTLGLYGVGIAAVGMLSTLGITLATDAYGPIADNAGGNAEMAGLPPDVRQRTDALDSLGNTTAATGKGFAIGSAALTALALLAAYVEEVKIGFERWGNQAVLDSDPEGIYKVAEGLVVYKNQAGVHPYLVMPGDRQHPQLREAWQNAKPSVSRGGAVSLDANLFTVDEPAGATPRLEFAASRVPLTPLQEATLPTVTAFYDATLMNPKVLVGLLLGAMSTFVFCALTMKAVGRAAQGMVEEVRRQFRERPGIMDGSEKPDYARPVAISTTAAQKEMMLPSLLGLLMPLAVGFLLGVPGVLGLLVGTLTSGFCVAIFMANAGGAWDNAKKFIEAGAHGGKNTEAHRAAVVGDTVGDPFKDTSGPSLNILIKLMSMVSVVAAGLIVRYSLTTLMP